MKTLNITLITLGSLLLSCGGGKTQLLEAEEMKPRTMAVRDSLQRSKMVYNAVKDKTFHSVDPTLKGKRIVSSNLIKLNLTSPEKEAKEVDLTDHYTKVSYVTLKHPQANEGMGYLGDTEVKAHIGRSVMTIGSFISESFLTNKYIVAGDGLMGYHLYDHKGEYIFSPVLANIEIDYNKSSNSVRYETENFNNFIRGFSVNENLASIRVIEDSVSRTHIYDLELQAGLQAYSNVAFDFVVSPNLFLSVNERTGGKGFIRLCSYSESSNSLSIVQFNNHNPKATTKGRRGSPERHRFAYYNNDLTLRQAYNDTIYGVKDAQTLEARYLLNSGSMKLSNTDANSEHKEGKLIINGWLETDVFFLLRCNIDQDFPNNRKDEKVTFRYYYYDKKEGKLYLKEGKKLYPEEYTLRCDIEESLPVLLQSAKMYQQKLYSSYTKHQLKNMMKSEIFKSYSQAQQDKVKTLHDELSDDSMVVMILE